jgi:hypothetical protein
MAPVPVLFQGFPAGNPELSGILMHPGAGPL